MQKILERVVATIGIIYLQA